MNIISLAKKLKNNTEAITEPQASELIRQEPVSKVIENEIECPRCLLFCRDIMMDKDRIVFGIPLKPQVVYIE